MKKIKYLKKSVVLLSIPVLALISVGAMASAVNYTGGTLQNLKCTSSPSGFGYCKNFQPNGPGFVLGVYHTNSKEFVFNMNSQTPPTLQFQNNTGNMSVCMKMGATMTQAPAQDCSEKNYSKHGTVYENITASAVYSPNNITFQPIGYTLQLPGLPALKIPAVTVTMSATEVATPAQSMVASNSGNSFLNPNLSAYLKK